MKIDPPMIDILDIPDNKQDNTNVKQDNADVNMEEVYNDNKNN